MNHEHWLELADIHALGALDGEELRAWKEHVGAGCPECQARIDAVQDVLSRIPMVAPMAPPASVKSALMGRIGSPAKTAVSPFLAPGLAVAAMAALVTLWFNLPALLEPGAPQTPVAADIAVPAPAAAPIPVVAPAPTPVPAPFHSAETEALLKDPLTRMIEFKDPETGEKKNARLYWNPKVCGGCLVVEGLSKTDLDKVYEFWAIDGGGPVAAGTFVVDDQGRGHLDISGLDLTRNFEKFAVTIEPLGGVAAPTGPMKLLSL